MQVSCIYPHANYMFDAVLAWVSTADNARFTIYWGITVVSILESLAFVGLIVPGTTIVIVVGILASRGVADIKDLIWCVALGGIVGDAISFYIGRWGTGLVSEQSRIFKKTYADKGVEFFRRYGDKSVVIARFVGPVRSIIPFAAGLSRMSVKKFFFFNIISAFLAAPVYLYFGYFFGEAWERVRHLRGPVELGFLALLVLVGAVLVFRKEKKKLLK